MMISDRKELLQAVRLEGTSIKNATEELKNDKEIVLEAVKQNGWALEHVSEELKNDKEVVLEAVKEDGYSLLYASEEAKNDKDIVLEAVRKDGDSLEYSSPELKNNHEIVLAAVRQKGWSLRFASEERRNDKEIVLEAVKQHSRSIQFVSDELKSDPEVIFARNFYQRERKFSFKFEETKESPEILNEEVFIETCRGKLKDKGFEDLEIHQFLGRGAYGGTYLTRVLDLEYYGAFVVKIYNDPLYGEKKKEEILSRDSLYLPYHRNVISILSHRSNETIDLHKLPDFEEYWKKKKGVKRLISNSGMILMKFHDSTLRSYVEKKEGGFETVELGRLLWGMFKGICHLHKNMIVHRDLHEKNIFVSAKKGRVWVGDFGCALDLRRNITKFKVHKDHQMMFSFTYYSNFKNEYNKDCGFKKGGHRTPVPPEIINFEPLESDYLDYEKCDVYSFGILGTNLLELELERRLEMIEDKNLIKSDELFTQIYDFFQKLIVVDPFSRIGCLESYNEFYENFVLNGYIK